MTTTLLNCEVLLSKDIGDFWEGTATGSTGVSSIRDEGLKAKANDWITDVSYTYVSGGSNNEEERKISSLDSTNGDLTVLAHGTSFAVGDTYRVHRLFEASEKRRALIAAAQNLFGDCYDLVWDESMVSGNWLKDGSFERWTTTTNLTDWAEGSLTATQVTAAGLFKHGSASVILTGTAGTLSQGFTENDELKFLAGKTVSFTLQGHCSTTSCLRLAIDDGTTESFSSYHDGDTSWTPNTDPLKVQATIDANPLEVTFKIVKEINNGTAYVDDARVISGYRSRLYIDQLGIANNEPNAIYIEPTYYSQEEPWIEIHDWTVDEGGYLRLPTGVSNNYRLRIIGKQYLDFLSSGTSSASWSATINLEEPQTRILSAQAALYLYTWMSMPNYESGIREDYQSMIGFWEGEVRKRKAKFGMPILPVTISWGFE